MKPSHFIDRPINHFSIQGIHHHIHRIFLVLCALLTSASLAADEYQWDSMAIGGGGFVSAIVTNKSEDGLIYARTDVGGAYRWDKKNQRWISLMDWVSDAETGLLGVESLATDPQHPERLYLLAGISYFNDGKTAILRSDNYGKTFTTIDVTQQFKAHGNHMGRQNGERLQVDPNNSDILYTGTRWNGLFKSRDAGNTWSRLAGLDVTTTPNDNGVNFVVLDAASTQQHATQTLYVGVSRYPTNGGNLYVSRDAGATFHEIKGGPANLMPQRAVLTPDGNLIITYANGSGPHGHWISALAEPMDRGEIWNYNTQKNTWKNITPAGVTRSFGGISVDPHNAKRLIASTINNYQLQYGNAYGDRIFISTDSGEHWTDVVARGFNLDTKNISWINGNAIHWAGSIEFDPFDSQSVFVTSGNGIFKTNNIDATPTTWAFTVAGLEETVPLNLISIPKGPIMSVIGDYDGFRHTDPSQYAPIHEPRVGSSTGICFATKNTQQVARVGGRDKTKLFFSRDMGITWKPSEQLKGIDGEIAFSADGRVLLHSPKDSDVTYYTKDEGKTWQAVEGLSVKNAVPVADPVDKKIFYALNGDSLMISKDWGAHFSAAGKLSSSTGNKKLRVAPDHTGDIWIPLYDKGLARSTNRGKSFSPIKGVTYAAAVGFGMKAPHAKYPTVFIWGTVNNVRGIYRSIDEGKSWTRINDDAHQYGGPGNGQFISGDMNQFGVVYMGTAGRGIIYGKPSN